MQEHTQNSMLSYMLFYILYTMTYLYDFTLYNIHAYKICMLFYSILFVAC